MFGNSNNNSGMFMPVAPAYGGGYGGGFGSFGGDGGWWVLLLILAMANGGWGLGGFGGMGMGMMMPWMMGMGGGFGLDYLYPWLDNSQHISDGFRDQQLSSSIAGVQSAVTSGFGDTALGIAGVNQNICATGNGITAAVTGAQNALSNQINANQLAALERSFAAQVANTQGLNALQAALAQCCCDNRLSIANLGADIAREACADRAAVGDALQNVTMQNLQSTNQILTTFSAGIQSIKDELCQDRLDAERRENANLRTQLNMRDLAASQAEQTAKLVADNAAQTQYIVNRVAPYPIPSYPVPNPYGYNGNYGSGGWGNGWNNPFGFVGYGNGSF